MRAANVVLMMALGLVAGPAWAGIALWDDYLVLSGFASVSAAKSDNATPLYIHRRFDDDWCFDCDTTVGLQLDSQLSDSWRASAQVVKRPQDTFSDPQFEWGYLGWQLTDNLEARGGRLRLPLFVASEYYYVGNAYPWARPPIDVYGTMLGITAFNGIDLLYNYSLGDELQLQLHPFYGGHNHENVDFGPSTLEIETEVQAGINLKLHGARFLLNFTYFYADFEVGGDPDTLDVFSLGGRYEFDQWELWAEFERDKLQHAAYVAAAWHLELWQPYVMVSQAWKRLESTSYIAGVRYNWLPNLSVNLEYQLADARNGSSGQFTLPPQVMGESSEANLVTLMLSYNF
ncbi:hypothetical protein [Ferrimonas kyonanensis]|uniref:hypothetical protein n=1 Tax=Ferrimonas kyonanensis TaxID=364763 RepID=UPI0004879D54|nr:hypothetical protein [Ferrimonas kyonanensis]